MSSYWAACSGQGLVLTASEISEFFRNYKEKCEDKTLIDQIEMVEENEMDISEITFMTPDGRPFGLICADDFFTAGFCLIPYRIGGMPNKDWKRNEDIPSKDVYILQAERAIDGMECFEKKAYESYEEFLNEFKGKMADYLPASFDWESRAGIYDYACYA